MESFVSRVTIVVTGAFVALVSAAWLFWDQDLRYRLPTPVPPGYTAPALGDTLILPAGFPRSDLRPVLIHFYNPRCPCSRFGLEHLKELELRFVNRLRIVAVIADLDSLAAARRHFERHGLTIPIWTDPADRFAVQAGVYSTPQALLVDGSSRIFYRGNYNRSRYCRDRETEFVRLAIEALLDGRSLPSLPAESMKAWGCPRVPLPMRNPRSLAPRPAS